MNVSLSRFTGFFSGFKPIEKISETVKPFLTMKVAAVAHLAFGILAMLYNHPNAGVLLFSIGTAIVIDQSNVLNRLATFLGGIFRFSKPTSAPQSSSVTPPASNPVDKAASDDSLKPKTPRRKKSSDRLSRHGSSHSVKHSRLKKSERTPSTIQIDQHPSEVEKKNPEAEKISSEKTKKPKRSISQKLIHALHLDNPSEAQKKG